MRRIVTLLLAAVMVMSLTGCGEQAQENNSSQADSATANTDKEDVAGGENTAPAKGKTLVVYFSTPGVDGVDAVSRASSNLRGDDIVGNTEFVALLVQKAMDADLFRVETVKPYPEDVNELLEYEAEETDNNVHPELSTHIENLDDYDTIMVGVPVWNYGLPMPMYSFFEEYDFSGKTIGVFTTHRGSGLSGIPETVAELEPDANVLTDGFTVAGDEAAGVTQDDITEWVDSLFQ